MKTCARWRSRARFTSGLYTTENSGRLDSGSVEFGVCSGPEFAGVSTDMVSKVLSDVLGTELEIAELGVAPWSAISIGERRSWNVPRRKVQNVGAAEVFRLVEGAVDAGTNFFLQSWQILFRSSSISLKSVLTVDPDHFKSPICDDTTHPIEHIDLLSYEIKQVRL